MEELEAQRLGKLEEQRAMSDQLNHLLTKDGGLIQSQAKTCKNLEVAVAVSKRPGFFEYYDPPDDVKRVYRSGECGTLVKKISRAQSELDAIDAEIAERRGAEAKARRKALFAVGPGDETSFDQWFAQYGRPKTLGASGFTTTFERNPKVYGGTTHHRAFRTQALKMKKGRCVN